MDYVALGKSNLMVSRAAFGAQSLELVKDEETVNALIKAAYDDGVNFYDTSNQSPESERRLGKALAAVRRDVYIATKTSAANADELSAAVESSLDNLQTDYIDLYQLENPSCLPAKDGSDGLVERLMELKQAGKIKHIGIVTESMEIALSMLVSDVPWESLQFPFNMLYGEETENLTKEFYKSDIGFIAMRPLCGGIISNIPLALGYIRQFENVVPIWGSTNIEELQQILYFAKNPPNIDEKFNEECAEIRARFN